MLFRAWKAEAGQFLRHWVYGKKELGEMTRQISQLEGSDELFESEKPLTRRHVEAKWFGRVSEKICLVSEN